MRYVRCALLSVPLETGGGGGVWLVSASSKSPSCKVQAVPPVAGLACASRQNLKAENGAQKIAWHWLKLVQPEPVLGTELGTLTTPKTECNGHNSSPATALGEVLSGARERERERESPLAHVRPLLLPVVAAKTKFGRITHTHTEQRQ